jgi:hypothetical protein
MDDRECILSHGPRPALDDLPSLRMRVRVERLGRSAHVALAHKLTQLFCQHDLSPSNFHGPAEDIDGIRAVCQLAGQFQCKGACRVLAAASSSEAH